MASGDAGVASAMVNTSQQIGGSLGIALLSTLFGGAVSDFAPAAGTAAALAQAQAAVHGSTVVFWWGAGILTVGAVVTALLFERGQAPALEVAAAEPVPQPAC